MRWFFINAKCLCFQMELVVRFQPSEVENLPVWRHVLLRALSQEARQRVETGIVGLSQKALTDWQNGGYKLGQMDKVVRTTLAATFCHNIF